MKEKTKERRSQPGAIPISQLAYVYLRLIVHFILIHFTRLPGHHTSHRRCLMTFQQCSRTCFRSLLVVSSLVVASFTGFPQRTSNDFYFHLSPFALTTALDTKMKTYQCTPACVSKQTRNRSSLGNGGDGSSLW